MSSITTKLETITPQLAEKYLKFNESNRSVRWAHVETLKQDILHGRWLTTHQGIAFGSDGVLIDGQHRLLAIRAAGASVKMLVARGVEPHVNGNVDLFAMDVIDNGRSRTAADQLMLKHGTANATSTVAAVRIIVWICAPEFAKRAITTSVAVPILAIYSKEIARMIELSQQSRRIGRKAPVLGILAFCAKIDSALADEFMDSLCTGENLKSGDPVYSLRNWIIDHPMGGKYSRDLFIRVVANAFYNAAKGVEIKQSKASDAGLDYIRSKQRGNVDKVRAILSAK